MACFMTGASETVETIVLLLIVSSGVYSLFSLFCVVEFFTRKGECGEVLSHTPVSIIKPLRGYDPNLQDNIRSFCVQDYPEYEVLLGFTDPGDSALADAREVAAAQPDCAVRVVVNETGPGVNRKISNLQGLAEAARYTLLAMSDSDMRADRDYLGRITGEYFSRENVGLVTSLYKIPNPVSAGAALESLTIALDFIPSVLVARRLEGITFGLGASMFLSKKSLEDIGGFSVIADYLADDYRIGNRLWEKGYHIILSRYVIENVAGHMSMADYLIHQLRWARTYRASRPKGFFGYGITHMLPLSLVYLFLHGTTILSLSMVGAVLVLRLGLALVLYRKVIRSRGWLKWLPIVPIKDVLSFGIWVWSFSGRKVFWRGKYYRIEKDGRIREEA